jgi:hypothetical protein
VRGREVERPLEAADGGPEVRVRLAVLAPVGVGVPALAEAPGPGDAGVGRRVDQVALDCRNRGSQPRPGRRRVGLDAVPRRRQQSAGLLPVLGGALAVPGLQPVAQFGHVLSGVAEPGRDGIPHVAHSLGVPADRLDVPALGRPKAVGPLPPDRDVDRAPEQAVAPVEGLDLAERDRSHLRPGGRVHPETELPVGRDEGAPALLRRLQGLGPVQPLDPVGTRQQVSDGLVVGERRLDRRDDVVRDHG